MVYPCTRLARCAASRRRIFQKHTYCQQIFVWCCRVCELPRVLIHHFPGYISLTNLASKLIFSISNASFGSAGYSQLNLCEHCLRCYKLRRGYVQGQMKWNNCQLSTSERKHVFSRMAALRAVSQDTGTVTPLHNPHRELSILSAGCINAIDTRTSRALIDLDTLIESIDSYRRWWCRVHR